MKKEECISVVSVVFAILFVIMQMYCLFEVATSPALSYNWSEVDMFCYFWQMSFYFKGWVIFGLLSVATFAPVGGLFAIIMFLAAFYVPSTVAYYKPVAYEDGLTTLSLMVNFAIFLMAFPAMIIQVLLYETTKKKVSLQK